MIGITATPALGQWQHWRAPEPDEEAATPVEIKLEWGERFGAIIPESYKLFGPIGVFESINRLIRDGKLEVRCKLSQRRGGRGFLWRVEYRLTGQGLEYRKAE